MTQQSSVSQFQKYDEVVHDEDSQKSAMNYLSAESFQEHPEDDGSNFNHLNEREQETVGGDSQKERYNNSPKHFLVNLHDKCT